MRRIKKKEDSEILAKKLRYPAHRTAIREALISENGRICVYTETYFGRADRAEIEHFNPELKGTDGDGYHNWFLVKSQWNGEKGEKWQEYQPVLLPQAEDFEERIVYDGGDYILGNEDDKEALNTMKLLQLDDPDLAQERKAYISRNRNYINLLQETPEEYFSKLLKSEPQAVYFIRALKEEFGFIHPNY